MIKAIGSVFLLLFSTYIYSACNGRIFNPITDLNWNNAFPITVGGISGTSGPNNPPLHRMPAICKCGPKPGVGVTYWEPRFVAEVARTAGCLSTVGGVDILGPSAKFLSSEVERNGNSTSRLQLHWFDYPVMAAMDVASSYAGCVSLPEFKLATPTEIDPLWNNEIGAALNDPESLLFANPLALLSCIPDAMASMANFPLDMLFWCAGSQGVVYPLMGRGQTNAKAGPSGNLHMVEKYIARETKLGKLLATIGPTAQCSQSYMPTWIKSQYRIDLIYPIASNDEIVIGKPGVMWDAAKNTAPITENAFMIWRGRQCCARPY